MRRIPVIICWIFSIVLGLQMKLTAQTTDGCECSRLNVAILGDSMSWIGGENCENPKGWTYYFKESVGPGSIKLYARSGATLTNTKRTQVAPEAYSEILNDDNVIYNQAVRLSDDLLQLHTPLPGLVIIYAGANDAWFENSRPGADEMAMDSLQTVEESDLPSMRTTLGESLALSIKKIRKAVPETNILLVTPVEMSKISPRKIHDMSERIERIGSLLDCEVLRADLEVPIKHGEEKVKFKNTSDGVHTNPRGAKLLSEFISGYVKENYCGNIQRGN